MNTRRTVMAAAVGVGVAVAPLAHASAAPPPKTYPAQVTLVGNPCLLKGMKLSKWNLTYQLTSNYGLPGRGETLDGGGSSPTHTFNLKYTGEDGWFLVQTWCGKGAFSRFLGRASDTCSSVLPTATKKNPAKVEVDIVAPPTGSDECVGY